MFIHKQSCERVAHKVDLSTKAVDGQEQRGGLVRARIDHCMLLPVFRSKKEITRSFAN